MRIINIIIVIVAFILSSCSSQEERARKVAIEDLKTIVERPNTLELLEFSLDSTYAPFGNEELYQCANLYNVYHGEELKKGNVVAMKMMMDFVSDMQIGFDKNDKDTQEYLAMKDSVENIEARMRRMFFQSNREFDGYVANITFSEKDEFGEIKTKKFKVFLDKDLKKAKFRLYLDSYITDDVLNIVRSMYNKFGKK